MLQNREKNITNTKETFFNEFFLSRVYPDIDKKKNQIITMRKGIRMFIKVAAAITAFLIGIFWWIRKQKVHQPDMDQGENKEELDEEQAAITAATWTVLHPPS